MDADHERDRIVEAAEDSTLTVLPGVMIRTAIAGCDDVVLSCLFPEEHRTADISKFLDALRVPTRARGDKKHLVSLPFDDVLECVAEHEGLAIPSRMDKTPYRKLAIPIFMEVLQKENLFH